MVKLSTTLLGMLLFASPSWANEGREFVGDHASPALPSHDSSTATLPPLQGVESAETPPPAPITAQQTLQAFENRWTDVYQRADETVKTGGYVVLGGTAAVAVGVTTILLDTGGQNLGAGVLGGLGLVGLFVGSPVMAGGSIRQAKALRTINPSAPGSGFGAAAWTVWGLGFFLPTAEGPGIGPRVFALPVSAVLAKLQHAQNRRHWTAGASAQSQNADSRMKINVVATRIEGGQGAALVGRF